MCGKPDCLFASRLMPYLLGLFYWGACRVSKLEPTSRKKGCKIDRIDWEMHVTSSFWLSFCEYMHEYPLPIHCAAIPPKFRRIRCNEWAVGTHAYSHKRESPKLDITCISHSIRSILQPFILDVAPQFTQPARAPVKQS